MNVKRAGQITLLLCGVALGIVLAYVVAVETQLQDGKTILRNYADRLVHAGDEVGISDAQAIQAVSHDGFPFCSDQDLAFMRDFVFRSAHIRDIGRVRNNMLYCSTGIGRLDTPKLTQPPDVTGNAGLKIVVRAHLLISPNTTGLVVEQNSVAIVLNPDSFIDFNENPRYFSAVLFDRPNHRMIQALGPPMPLTMDEIIAGRMIERNGIIYQPICGSPRAMLCEIAAESRADVLSRRRIRFFTWLTGGALLGGAVVLILMLFWARQQSVELQLRRAIRRDDLTLVYQPVVDLATGAIVGAEALVRWVNEAGEHVRPDVFVAMAEERGFVKQITRLVLRKAIAEVGDLLSTNDFKLTINMTAEDLHDPEFFSLLQSSIKAGRLPASALGLELTERSAANRELAISTIRKLRAAGHLVYIDDFGTGYSSLAYLHQLGADAIKIDRSFTHTAGTDAVTASVVPQILSMAADLNMMVVVEGIETQEQADYFTSAGTGLMGQGWLFGFPMPAAELKKTIRESVEANYVPDPVKSMRTPMTGPA